MTPFDYLNAINQSKENLIVDELSEKKYVPFVVNKGLSYFSDTILYANEMNQLYLLDNKPQFLYLLNSIRPRKRYSKWFMHKINDDVHFISEHLNCNHKRAEEYLTLLTEEQLKSIKTENTK